MFVLFLLQEFDVYSPCGRQLSLSSPLHSFFFLMRCLPKVRILYIDKTYYTIQNNVEMTRDSDDTYELFRFYLLNSISKK